MTHSFYLQVELVPEKGEFSQTETLNFSSQPITFKEVKEKVEESCSVPECVQTLRYQGCVVPENSTLQSFYLRNGDCLSVSYLHKGQVQEVIGVVQWLQQCTKILTKLEEAGNSGGQKIMSYKSIEALADMQHPNLLADQLFSSWSDSTTLVNAMHFKSLGGTQLLVDFHKLVVKLRHRLNIFAEILSVPYLEYVCCRSIANYARDVETSRHIAQCGGLDSCIGSFLVKPADDESLKFNHNYVVLEEALRGIYNIGEVPEVQYALSLRQDVIQQAILAANTPIYSPHDTTKRTISVILCLSQCSEAHVNILKQDFVEQFLLMLENHQQNQGNSEDFNSEMMALKSYVGVVLAQMIRGRSSHLLQNFPIPLLLKMEVILKQACEGDSAEIQKYEESHGFSWGRFSSCVEYLYEPQVQHHSSNETFMSLIKSLQMYATDTLLQYLINSFGRRFHVEIVVKEKIVDYLVCLPWILPEQSRERSMKVLKEVAKFHPVKPPSLVTITKATLAKLKYGLKQLLVMESSSDLYTLS